MQDININNKYILYWCRYTSPHLAHGLGPKIWGGVYPISSGNKPPPPPATKIWLTQHLQYFRHNTQKTSLLSAIYLRQLFFYFKVNHSFNHFLTTVNTTFVLRFCKTSVTRPKLYQWIKTFTTFISCVAVTFRTLNFISCLLLYKSN